MKRSKQSLSGVLAALGAVAALSTGAETAVASSHREAPLIAEDPAADATDLYVFRTPQNATDVAVVPNSLVMVANYWPLEEPGGGPNFPRFSDNVLYEIKIDNNGDAVEDITYQFRFKTQYAQPGSFLFAAGPVAAKDSATLQVRQTYTVTRIVSGQAAEVLLQDQLTPPVYSGSFTMGNQATYDALVDTTVYPLKNDATGEGRVFAGQRDDPFFVDLGAIFDLVRIRCQATPNLAAGCAGGVPGPVKGVDYVAGYNVHSIVLQVPISKLTSTKTTPTASAKESVLGVWTSASRPRVTIRRAPAITTLGTTGPRVKVADHMGPWVQVSRLGIPLINEVIIPVGLKDYFNSTQPSNDALVFGSPQGGQLLTNPELAQALKALYNLPVPMAGRTDFVELVQFQVDPGATGTGVGPFKGKAYGLTPADILRIDVALAAPTTFVVNPAGALGVVGGTIDPSVGFPNGRRLQDDIVDIEEKVMAGVLRGSPMTGIVTDAVDANDRPFALKFPYVPSPWSGSEVNPIGGPYQYLHTAK